MPADLNELVMNGFATLKREQFAQLEQGGGRHAAPMPVEQIIAEVVRARLELASSHLAVADALLLSGSFRGSISRFYYAAYHAVRSVVFAATRGDDFSQHGVISAHLPPELPDVAKIKTFVEDARLLRNQADYEPYPKSDAHWEQDARRLAAMTAEVCSTCNLYADQVLLGRGEVSMTTEGTDVGGR